MIEGTITLYGWNQDRVFYNPLQGFAPNNKLLNQL